MAFSEHINKAKSVLRWIVDHKYMFSIIVLAVWLLFFDENNIVFQQWPKRSENKSLQKEKLFYMNKIREDSTMLSELQTNDDNLKKFAREQYFMKANDEDVFVIEER